MAPELSLLPSFHLLPPLFLSLSFLTPLQESCVFFKSTTSIPYRNLKMKKTLNMSSPSPFFLPVSHRLLPQSRGSLKVNPPQELSLPMLVRKSALKEKTASSLPPKKNKNNKANQPTEGRTGGRTDAGAAAFPSPSLSLAYYFLSALRFPGVFM